MATCVDCGTQVIAPSRRCRACYVASRRHAPRLCPGCSKPLAHPRAKLCRQCDAVSRIKPKPKCVDCGQELSTRLSKRCTPCANAHRRKRPPATCVDCSAPLRKSKTTRCRPCAIAWHRRAAPLKVRAPKPPKAPRKPTPTYELTRKRRKLVTVECPHCGEQTPKNDVTCRFCWKDLREQRVYKPEAWSNWVKRCPRCGHEFGLG